VARNVPFLVRLRGVLVVGGSTRGWSHLDEEVEGALLVVAAYRGVAAGDIFSVYFCRDGDVPPDRKAEDIVGAR
jgi:hypothetical protein